jgi:tRNA-dihydrouridine synthase
MGYSGEADWEAIAEIAAALPGLPVIGNGDITSGPKAAERLTQTACSGLMIGRAALRNPWLVRDAARAAAGLPPLPAHLDRTADLYGPERAAVMFRKWIPLYIRSLLKMQKPVMVHLLTISGFPELRDALASHPV